WAARTQLGNVQTWLFARRGSYLTGLADNPLGLDDLAEAKRNLAACAAVGVTDRLDDWLRLLCATLGWPQARAATREDRTPPPPLARRSRRCTRTTGSCCAS